MLVSVTHVHAADADWEAASQQGVTVLMDRVAEVGGLRILGSPATPEYYGSFQVRKKCVMRLCVNTVPS
jgi:hypothetical protein